MQKFSIGVTTTTEIHWINEEADRFEWNGEEGHYVFWRENEEGKQAFVASYPVSRTIIRNMGKINE